MKNKTIYKEYYIIQAYNKVRTGVNKTFGPHFFNDGDRMLKIKIITKYYVEEILKISPEEALKIFNYEMAKESKLNILLRYLKRYKPIEYRTDKTYVKHLLYITYPFLPKDNFKNRTIQCYKEVLSGKRKTFPKNYFKEYKGEERAKICFEYLWQEILKINFENIKDVFLIKKENGNKILKKYKLRVILQMLYYSIQDMLENMYPEEEEFKVKGDEN